MNQLSDFEKEMEDVLEFHNSQIKNLEKGLRDTADFFGIDYETLEDKSKVSELSEEDLYAAVGEKLKEEELERNLITARVCLPVCDIEISVECLRKKNFFIYASYYEKENAFSPNKYHKRDYQCKTVVEVLKNITLDNSHALDLWPDDIDELEKFILTKFEDYVDLKGRYHYPDIGLRQMPGGYEYKYGEQEFIDRRSSRGHSPIFNFHFKKR